ncbi:hypothetical protein [Tautonia plasticadhaerens]|uniref:Carboxypeptidase regulatory-like domain-containing protein n=1 Tax=Tautonia plasticadhaerens TaxID=2527974 RepID=A0A518H896_9BACT|nr:hypothetical protein [Tautonia plasticadhaerens]QDV37082.1 hypothetical protein ElP_50150 [Tautonia plasticadhaerens]
MKIAHGAGRISVRRLLVAILLATAGCAEEAGPEPMPTAPVDGLVLLSGRPLPGGWLEFLPVEGTVGRLRSARIGPDGSFRAEGVAEGTVAVRVAGAALPPPYAALLGQVFLIRRDVPPGGATGLVIDLDREYRSTAADPPR